MSAREELTIRIQQHEAASERWWRVIERASDVMVVAGCVSVTWSVVAAFPVGPYLTIASSHGLHVGDVVVGAVAGLVIVTWFASKARGR